MYNENYYCLGFWYVYDGEFLFIYINFVFIIRSNIFFCLGGVSDYYGFCVIK